MKCSNCGMDLNEEDKFCPRCGIPVHNDASKLNNYQQNYQASNSYSNSKKSDDKKIRIGIVKAFIIAFTVMAVPLIIVLVVSVAMMIVGGANDAIDEATSILAEEESEKKSSSKNEKNEEPTVSATPVSTTPGNKYGTTTSETEKPSISATPSGSYGKTSSTSNTNFSSYQVNYAGFKLYFPDDMLYQMDNVNDMLFIGDYYGTWQGFLQIQAGDFQQQKQNMNYIYIALAEYDVKNVTLETVSGVEFIIVEVEIGGQKGIIALTSLDATHNVVVTIINEDNSYDRTNLNDIVSIVQTATYTGETSHLEINEEIPFKDIIEKIQNIEQNDNEE